MTRAPGNDRPLAAMHVEPHDTPEPLAARIRSEPHARVAGRLMMTSPPSPQ